MCSKAAQPGGGLCLHRSLFMMSCGKDDKMRYIDETPCSSLVQELRFLIKFLSRRLGFKSRRLGNQVSVTPSSISWKSSRLDIPSSRFFSRLSAVNENPEEPVKLTNDVKQKQTTTKKKNKSQETIKQLKSSKS